MRAEIKAAWRGARRLLKTEKPVFEHKSLIRSFGGDRGLTAFFEQLLFWSDKGSDSEGWIHKTYAEWDEELCLSPYQIRQAVGRLMARGLLERQQRRRPDGTHPYHYRLIPDAAVAWIAAAMGTPQAPVAPEAPSRDTSGDTSGDTSVTDEDLETEQGKMQNRIDQDAESHEARCDSASCFMVDAVSDSSSLRAASWGDAESDTGTARPEAAPPHLHTLPPPPRPAAPEVTEEPDPFFAALVRVCQLDTSAMEEGDGYSRGIGAAVVGLRERGAEPGDVLAFGRWWRDHHMRNGSPPEVRQIVPNWLRFQAWRKRSAPLPAAPMVAEVKALTPEAMRETQARSREELERVKGRLREENRAIAQRGHRRGVARPAGGAVPPGASRDRPAP